MQALPPIFFAELHSEKLALIFENIEILSNMKESDTQLPPRFFKEITDDVIFDYKAKIGILNKNTKFVTKELIYADLPPDKEQAKRLSKRIYKDAMTAVCAEQADGKALAPACD